MKNTRLSYVCRWSSLRPLFSIARSDRNITIANRCALVLIVALFPIMNLGWDARCLADPGSRLWISAQPASQTVSAGQSATFAVVASGRGNISYQWYKNGTPVSGANSSSYTTPPTTSSDNGEQFVVVVSSKFGNLSSSTATLTVNAPAAVAPSIATQPINQTVIVGQTATFSVAVNGTTPLAYQWQKNGVAIAGATSSSYTTPAATTTDNASTFRVAVSNAAGNATSNAAYGHPGAAYQTGHADRQLCLYSRTSAEPDIDYFLKRRRWFSGLSSLDHHQYRHGSSEYHPNQCDRRSIQC